MRIATRGRSSHSTASPAIGKRAIANGQLARARGNGLAKIIGGASPLKSLAAPAMKLGSIRRHVALIAVERPPLAATDVFWFSAARSPAALEEASHTGRFDSGILPKSACNRPGRRHGTYAAANLPTRQLVKSRSACEHKGNMCGLCQAGLSAHDNVGLLRIGRLAR